MPWNQSEGGWRSQVIGEHLQWGKDEGGPRQKVHTMRQGDLKTVTQSG